MGNLISHGTFLILEKSHGPILIFRKVPLDSFETIKVPWEIKSPIGLDKFPWDFNHFKTFPWDFSKIRSPMGQFSPMGNYNFISNSHGKLSNSHGTLKFPMGKFKVQWESEFSHGNFYLFS